MSRKKKAKPIITRKKRTRSRKDGADKPRDLYGEKQSGGRMPIHDSVFLEEVDKIRTGRLRGRLKGYAE